MSVLWLMLRLCGFALFLGLLAFCVLCLLILIV